MKRLGKIKTLAVAALSAVALATPLAIAQTSAQDSQSKPRAEKHGFGKGRGHHRGGRMHGFGFGQLNLTDDQKARMGQIHQSFGERTKGLHEQLRAKRQELRQAESGGTFNEALATQKLTEAASIEAKLMGEQFKLRQEMLSILTPEQKTQMEQQREQFKQQREQFKGRRGEGRGRRGEQQQQQQMQ